MTQKKRKNSDTRRNYTIIANASHTLGETNIENNIYVVSSVFISILGDINGPDGWPDGKVDIRDVAVASHAM